MSKRRIRSRLWCRRAKLARRAVITRRHIDVAMNALLSRVSDEVVAILEAFPYAIRTALTPTRHPAQELQ